jgi:hypothetical protein
MGTRTRILVVATTVALFSVLSTAALAVNPHFKHGGDPTCAIVYSSDGTSASVTCSAILAGLGNFDVQADLSVNGNAVYNCQNAGGNIAPGQNRVLIGPATSSTSFPASEIKNGNLAITTNPAVLTAPATVSSDVAGCPNPNWIGVNPVVSVTDITLVLSQPPGNTIFTCTASDPDGLSNTVALSC